MTKHVFFVLLVLIGLSSCGKFHRAQKSDDIQEKYGYAIGYYEKKDYYKAGVLFEELIPIVKGQEMAEKCQFYYANTQYHQRNYMMSSYYYKKFVDTYPRSKYAEEAMFLYGKSQFLDSPQPSLDQTNTYGALDAIQLFLSAYPNSSYKEECNQMVDQMRRKLETKAYDQTKLYYKIGDYKASVVAFTTFKREYPESIHNEEFAYLKISAQQKYAHKSIEIRQKERYSKAIEFYEEFVDKYQSSVYQKDAEDVYDECVSKLNKLSQTYHHKNN